MPYTPLNIIQIVIIFQLFIFSCFLLSRVKSEYSNLLFSFHLISQAIGIFTNISYFGKISYLEQHPELVLLSYPFMFCWGPTFYFYIRSLADKNFKVSIYHFFHLLPFLTFFAYSIFILINRSDSIGLVYNYEFLYLKYSKEIQIIIRIIVFIYIIEAYKLLRKVQNTFNSDTKHNYYRLHWFKFLINGFTISFFVSLLSFFAYLFILPSNIFLFINIFIYFGFFNFVFFKGWISPEIFSPSVEIPRYKINRLPKEDSILLLNQLTNYMILNKPYLDPDITLNKLAEETKIVRRTLSQIINDQLGQNFNDFINYYRIEEAKPLLIESSNKTILEILYSTGFNSKSVFNRAFKKHTGLTPTEFIRKYKQT